ncbi:hypothetical protein [uncultured Pseudoalteromonas sp.]|uniref:hypothetical protein n=1 Tax=uncultured Pseudoalteromonas sp. TaxID=114053 RepID=UPI002594E973|nr:hypothetical protein [uncultured Pseudoalteromonas sp.]
MTADEFKVWAKKYGLSIEDAGAVLGTSRSNAFKFANGSRPVSKAAYYNAEAIDLLPKDKSLKLIQKRLA